MERAGWDEFLKRPVGTGPYMVEGVVKDYRKVQEGEVYAALVANPNYWNRGYPKIQKVRFANTPPRRPCVRGRDERDFDRKVWR